MRLDTLPQDLLGDFGVVTKYYAGRICSCIGKNNGSYDPTCGCLGGFRYKEPVEYKLIRSSIRYDKLTEKAGQILQGGCLFTIPRKLTKHNAQITGSKDLSNGIDLTSEYKLKISIDDMTAIEINCKTDAGDESDVKIRRILSNINTALSGEVAFESDINGNIGHGYITIKSLIFGENSKVRILKPSGNDATYDILGLSESQYPYDYNINNTGEIYLPLYNSLSIGDVFVMKNRTFRDSAICQKGVNDIIRAFDIEDIELISVKDTIYKPGVDYSFSGNTITWIGGGSSPDEGEYYSVEHLLPLQYVVLPDMGADRGADDDQFAKKVMAALRNYINAQSLTIDYLGV